MAMFETPAPQPARGSKRTGGFRRGVTWLLVLTVIGGLAYAGFTYGPDVVARFTDPDAADGPAAPLEYPVATATPVAVRTATFTVSESDAFGGTQNYEVTADFESGVARIVVPRTDTPDLEILTLWDQSFIRRIDEPTWYTLPRGDFPIDFSMGRTRWVRTLDELLPPAFRPGTTIDEANESTVGAESTRRIVVSAPPAALLALPAAGTAAPAAPPADPAPAPDGSQPTDGALAPAVVVPEPVAALPPGIAVQPGIAGAESLTMEIWVDGSGIVRKSVMPVELGGETITITAVSPDGFEPLFPTPDVVAPLTAQVLFRLGL